MGKKAGKIKISQCMIVKNEEQDIRRALSWGKGIVSEQIVVDTGSTDNTVQIAEEMGAKVFHFEWCDDFSAAKNYAIEQASGDWIAFLDADEYFSEQDARKIPGLLKKIENASLKSGRIHLVRTALVDLNDDGEIFSVGQQDRIFRNMKGLRYKNRTPCPRSYMFFKRSAPALHYSGFVHHAHRLQALHKRRKGKPQHRPA